MEKCLGLLTGKKRLPGFSGEWRTKKLGQLLKIPVTDGPHLIQAIFMESGEESNQLLCFSYGISGHRSRFKALVWP